MKKRVVIILLLLPFCACSVYLLFFKKMDYPTQESDLEQMVTTSSLTLSTKVFDTTVEQLELLREDVAFLEAGTKKVFTIGVGDTYEERYAPVLDTYRQAITQEWEAVKLSQAGISPMHATNSGQSNLTQIGYTYIDLNGDNQCELVLGSMIDDQPQTYQLVYDIYMIDGEEIISLASSEESSRYYICIEEAGGWQIALEKLENTSKKYWHYYILEDSHLSVIQAVIYDKSASMEKPWFIAYDEDFETGNDEPIDEDVAKDIIDSYRSNYILLDYDCLIETE